LDPEENTPIHLRSEYRNSREQAERKKRKDRELDEDLLEEERFKKEEEEQKAKLAVKVPEKPVKIEKKEQVKRAAVTFDEEDMDAKEKKLIPIQYSKEERAVGKDRKSKSRSETIRKSIMSKIPKSLEELSKYDIKWEYFDLAGKSVHSKISSACITILP
jgi:hypothetical protein